MTILLVNLKNFILMFALELILFSFEGLLQYPDEILCIGILASKNSSWECFWRDHVSMMPKELNSTIFWTDEEILKLAPSAIFHLAKMMKNQILQDWKSIYEPLINKFSSYFQEITIEDYKWALGMVYSRAVGFTLQSNSEYIRCIPPVIDFANHSLTAGFQAADTFIFDEALKSLNLLNATKKEINEECFAVYG
jgi:[ribulose-bisphosphate carboxylase]-lysine N-methyltransferase